MEVCHTIIFKHSPPTGPASGNNNFVLQICWSALLAASFNGNLDIVKTLIQAGSNVNQSDKVGTGIIVQ